MKSAHRKHTSELTRGRRVVIKIGTNALMNTGAPNIQLLKSIAAQINELKRAGKEILIVSSGAIGFGASRLQETPPVRALAMRQACAAVGQPYLMAAYERALKTYGIPCAQLLLTRANFTNEKTFTAVKRCLNTLLKKNTVPIINENDSVAIDEIETRIFGDNDQLSAMVAAHFRAKTLVLLTDIDALYDKNPREHKDASPIHTVTGSARDYLAPAAGATGSVVGTGGMRTKLLAADIAQRNSCITIIAKADVKNVLTDTLLRGTATGTILFPITTKRAVKNTTLSRT